MHVPPPAALATFLLLLAAQLAAFLPSARRAAAPLGLLCMLAAFAGGLMDLRALALGLPALLLATAIQRLPRGWPSHIAFALYALWVLAAVIHRLPGFSAWLWTEEFGRSAALPLRWQLDKGVAGLVLLLALPPCPGGGLRRWALVPLAGLAIPLLALATGQVGLDPFWGNGFALWLAGNLFLTTIPEEAFFRGLIQGGLQRLAGDRMPYPAILVLAAVPFALSHLSWGLAFTVMALLAGLIYGAMYGAERTLGPAIATHFLTNAAVLLLTRGPFG